MFVKNDAEMPRRYFNGKIGTITHINKEEISIMWGVSMISVSPVTWENVATTAPKTMELKKSDYDTLRFHYGSRGR